MKTFVRVWLVALLLLSAIPMMGGLQHGYSTVYKTGMKPGFYMKYNIKHSPDLESATFRVRSIENQTMTLDVSLTMTDKSNRNETLIVTIGRTYQLNNTKSITSSNETRSWALVSGTGSISSSGGVISIVSKPDIGRPSSEAKYTFPQLINASMASHIRIEFSVDGMSEGERLFLLLEDSRNHVAFFELNYTGGFDPRRQERFFGVFEENVLKLSKVRKEIDLAKLASISIVYAGSSTRSISIKDIQLIEPFKVGHSFNYTSAYPIYLIISSGLALRDQIYPDLTQIVEQVGEGTHQDTKRKTVTSRVGVTEGGARFVFASYTWDAETGILISSWSTAKGYREIELADTNAWGPAHFLEFFVVRSSSVLSGLWRAGGGLVTPIIGLWIVSFGILVLHDKYRRGELKQFKQWLPFLWILIIASLVTFFLLQVLPRLFG